ncbi:MULTISPECIES: hypothetical protein [unclassified Microcoleus]|uniref:hypothetical protein n=1 Tax=unclassified Microcoleus TaxID=2642155 RepID=UPI0025D4AAD0|nr:MULTISPECIES: hypothetical protein [unclassified Microcoleus]
MNIRNEVTTRMLSVESRIKRVGANRMLRIGKIESEANALSNFKDMPTDSR